MRRSRSNTVVSEARRGVKHRRVNPDSSRSESLRASSHLSSVASNIPLDVLRIIMSFVPLHPRLRVVSLVCRRWRSAALQSVDHLHTSRPSSAATALRFLPFVTSLSLCTVSSELQVPTGLRILRLFEPPRHPSRYVRLSCWTHATNNDHIRTLSARVGTFLISQR